MKIKREEMRLVQVTWLDIVADLHSEEDIVPVKSYSVGWIEEQNNQYIRLLTCFYEEDGCDLADKIVIPMGCVLYINDLIVDGA